MELLPAERTEIYKAKSAGSHITDHFKENTITKWQRQWNDRDRRRWKARLIPDIRPWIGRKFGEVNYYVTQLLLGPRYFRKYLHRMDKTSPLYFLYEGREIIDAAKYTVFKCARWQNYRSELMSIIATITATNIVCAIIACRENWESVANYMERMLYLEKRDLEVAEHVGVPA